MTARAFFAWVRIPTVFSSMGNAYAGWWLGGHTDGTALVLGMLAAGLFLMAGMGLNDIADYKVDQVERPKRPLPSGAISLPRAWVMSLGMLGLGLGLQALGNLRAVWVGLSLIAAIFLYNFVLKGTWAGPLAMGLCRLLNVLGGMALSWQAGSSGEPSGLPFGLPIDLPLGSQIALLSLGAYIAAVTFLARDEVQGNSQARVRGFLFFLGLWMGAWMALGWRGLAPWWGIVATLAALIALIGQPLGDLWRKPTPAHTGRMIGSLLRGIPLVDMLGLWAGGLPWHVVLSMAVFMVPGPLLMKKFYST
jgi:UbiA prenyltransferase family